MEIASITAAELLFAQWEMDLIGNEAEQFDHLVERYMNLVYSYPTLDMLLEQQNNLDELWMML